MELAAALGKQLPRMVPLGALTLAVVLAWNRFYTIIGDGVCAVSVALGGGECSPGKVDDPQALLDAATTADGTGRGQEQLCRVLSSLPFAVEGCDAAAPSEPSCRGRSRASACDPTKWLGLGTSPGLSDCVVEATNETLPYELSVTPRERSRGPACNVTKIRIDADARVTFCFESLRLKVVRGYPGKLALGERYVASNPGDYCPAGQLQASYDAAGGAPSTSKLDIGRYALKGPAGPEIVTVPATVSGGARQGSDDNEDFKHSRRALAVAYLAREGNSQPTDAEILAKGRSIQREFEDKGFTWHHADLLKGSDGLYYYRMILVPSAIHDTTAHDGGSTWARTRGVTQPSREWDPLSTPPSLSPVLPKGWPSSIPRELPEECRPCTDEASP